MTTTNKIWSISRFERSDGIVFYQGPESSYDNKLRSLWESLRFKYCILSKYDNISSSYILGNPIPKHLWVSSIILLGKVLFKEARKWLRERF